ncbi:hypothetical protein [Portibacter marinus]|uniref:hypothetical protein n=1 Tax=Portibacter marinus TaxID=2898660 RepID=UPI001F47F954|nr:hypothetical protein [Portibacter marinus]
MGHWGPAIFSNDISADIKDEFNSLFNKEIPIPEIKKQIIENYQEGKSLEENTDLWLSLSYLMWQIGYNDSELTEQAIKIIDEGIDLKVWEELNADKSTLNRRRQKLIELKSKILQPNPKPKKPKLKKAPKSIIKKGECFAFQLNNGNYTAVLVLEEILNLDYYFVLIAQTNLSLESKPTIEDVMNSNILIEQPHQGTNSNHRLSISSYSNTKYKDVIKTFEKIGEVQISKDFSSNYLDFGATPWCWIPLKANEYLVEGKESPKVKLKTSNYIKSESQSKKRSIWNIFNRNIE